MDTNLKIVMILLIGVIIVASLRELIIWLLGVRKIHCLARKGSFERVKKLLEADGKLVNASGFLGLTPLHFAVAKGHEQVVDLLLDRGANINAKDKEGLTALHMAVEHGQEQIAGLLIEKGASVNARTNNNDTPLHYAIVWGSSRELVELLLEKGTNAVGSGDFTPLGLAQETGNKEIEELLRKYGALQ